MRSSLLYVVLAISVVSAPAANLVTNGSFETNAGGACAPGPPNNFVDIGVGSNCLTGWTVVSGTVDIIDSAGWQAENGNISIDMDGVNNGAISQSFATVAGATYNVTFWLAGNFSDVPAIKTLQVTADGASSNYSFNSTGKTVTNMGWVQETFNFVATGPTATLEFLSTDNPSSAGGPAIDNVTVAEAPEPGSVGLVLVGLVGGFALTIRQRKTATT